MEEETTPARAMRLIAKHYKAYGDWTQAVTRYVGNVGDSEARDVLDEIGHWPSSEPELRALQRNFR